ncbi:MAG: LacI family transcriptional regulator [Chloroflexi bacterium]|nr:LacI family transcriptional regulator [Chloroflexota bacterium]MCI0648442.1 LacI family transcriptional regulator [Chloroflexota bacterium]MCI0727590.1 LacI family transcriptional regulator [Chloroflexota bacterium]
MPSTIYDVAEKAGVSISTVSRVLNGRNRVHPETRERISAAIKALNYQQNASARALATQQSDTLGFVIPQVNDPFFFEIVRGVEDAASAAGYSLLIASQPRHANEHHYLKLFRRRYVDAMVLAAIDAHRQEILEILARNVPVVLVQQDVGEDVPAFLVENYGGACALTAHLLQHGYGRFAYITGTDYTPDNLERLRGLRDTLAGYGLDIPPEYISQGDYLRGSGYQAMLRLLDLPKRPEVVFAANDQMASDALLAIRERGLRVPEDIALAGFDDVALASYVSPPLTTVHQPAYELGFRAAQVALGMVKEEGPIEPIRVVLPTKLVIRRSCGCSNETGR